MTVRILFLGSGALACPAVEMLLGRHGDELVGVVTQPDRPRGRHLRAAACPVKALAAARAVPVFTPERASEPEWVRPFAALRPDLLVVAAYGQFLKPPLLDLAPLGAINIHPSLLPRYRGAAPIQWALARGETVTGVTILFVSEAMDAGDIILQEKHPVTDEDTAGTLEPRLAALGARLLGDALDLLAAGPVPRRRQDEAHVTLAPRLTKEDGRLEWTRPAAELRNRIRGFNPWPCCHTWIPCDPPHLLRVLAAAVEPGAGDPGAVIGVSRAGPLVATGDGALRLTRVQPEGGRVMDGGAFACGQRHLAGVRLGAPTPSA